MSDNYSLADLKDTLKFYKDTVDKTIKITQYKNKNDIYNFLKSTGYEMETIPTKTKTSKAPKTKAPKTPKTPKTPKIKLEPINKSKDEAFSDLLKSTFIKLPGDHPLDREQVNKFLSACDPKVKVICKKLIDETDVISFEELTNRVNKILRNLMKMISGNNILYAYIKETFKDKSNYWLFEYVSLFLKHYTDDKLDIKIIDDFNNISEVKANVIIIDDCIYSGQQMGSILKKIKLEKKIKINIYMIIPYISKIGKRRITNNFTSNYSIYSSSKLIFFKDMYFIKEINDIIKTNEEKDSLKALTLYYGAIGTRHLIYFYHKLADTVSVPTPLYLGVVPTPANGMPVRIMDKLEIIKGKIVETKSNPLVIPIIKNCKEYITNINLSSPKCPHPPYKKRIENKLNEVINK